MKGYYLVTSKGEHQRYFFCWCCLACRLRMCLMAVQPSYLCSDVCSHLYTMIALSEGCSPTFFRRINMPFSSTSTESNLWYLVYKLYRYTLLTSPTPLPRRKIRNVHRVQHVLFLGPFLWNKVFFPDFPLFFSKKNTKHFQSWEI